MPWGESNPINFHYDATSGDASAGYAKKSLNFAAHTRILLLNAEMYNEDKGHEWLGINFKLDDLNMNILLKKQGPADVAVVLERAREFEGDQLFFRWESPDAADVLIARGSYRIWHGGPPYG